jgi:type VI secretion system secreted protein VgrG
MTARTDAPTQLSATIDGVDVEAHSVDATLAISTLFVLRIAARERQVAAAPPEARLGKPAQVSIEPIVGPALVVHGIVSALETRTELVGDELVHHHTIDVEPSVAALTIGRDHRYFQDMTAVDVMKRVLADAGADEHDIVWSLAGTYRKRDYTTQWGESDWVFIERLAREEGIAYRFDFEEDATKLVFFDDSGSAPTVEGGSIPYTDTGALEGARDQVFTLSLRHRATCDQIVLRDYDPAMPAVRLEATVAAGSERFPRYDYPGRYRTVDEGKSLARRRLEALRAERQVLRGSASNPRLWPGRIATIDGCPFPALETCLITRLRIAAHFGGVERDSTIIEFEAVPASVPYRPAHAEDAAVHLEGPQSAVVVGPSGKELHTDDTGRVRAQFYWDRVGKTDEKSSTWMRVGQFALGGSMVRPRIGWDVLVEHHVGDADAPLLLSHLYDGAHPPPYALPANKTRTAWQTATTPGDGTANEIRFEDKKGSEEIFMNASKDMAVAVGDTKTVSVGNNHTHDVGANAKIDVGSDRTIVIGKNQSVDIGASETLTIGGKDTIAIDGSETVSVGGARSVTVIMGKKLSADGGRSLTVGANMIGVSALGVGRAVLGSATVTVGSAFISAAATGLANATLGAGSETVGGAKLQVGAGGVSLNVKGALAETVGAAYASAAGDKFIETATGALTVLVGGAFIANAPTVEIEADSEITVICGGSSLTVKSGSIEVKSPAIPEPGAGIAKSGSKVQHNS